jgi:hypothetical protein
MARGMLHIKFFCNKLAFGAKAFLLRAALKALFTDI